MLEHATRLKRQPLVLDRDLDVQPIRKHSETDFLSLVSPSCGHSSTGSA